MWEVLLWYVKALHDDALLQHWLRMSAVKFSNCAHGGERPKQTTLRCSHATYDHLAQPCPGNHVHKPYQVSRHANAWKFNTAAESEYPWLLCVRICQALQSHLKPTFTFNPIQKSTFGHHQTKNHKGLIPEYFKIVTTKPLDDNYKLLPPLFQGDATGEENSEDQPIKYGVFHSPEQFVKKALKLAHPFDQLYSVEDVTRRNLFDLLTGGFSHVAHKRLQFAKKLACWSKELAVEEARYFATLPEHVQKVLRGKKLLLYKKVLMEAGCPDLEPCEMMTGLDLVGTASKISFL